MLYIIALRCIALLQKEPEPGIKTLLYTWFGIEDEHLRQMLQALLIDRFQLKFHRETKTGDVYLLEQGGKPLALHAADTPHGGADPEGYGNIGYVDARWSIYAYSMPQLAKFAADYMVHVPVLDRTGLSGSSITRNGSPTWTRRMARTKRTPSCTSWLRPS